MQVETEVVHAVVAVGEAEVDVAPTELHSLCLLEDLTQSRGIFAEDRRVVDRLTAFAFQHTALEPNLEST